MFKTSESLRQCYGDKPHATSVNFESFKCKIRIAWNTPVVGNTEDIEIAVLKSFLENSWNEQIKIEKLIIDKKISQKIFTGYNQTIQ